MSKHHVDLSNSSKSTFLLNVVPGDTVVYTCPYSFNKDMKHICARERDFFDRKLFCFDHVIINRNVFQLRDYVRGAYNIVSKYVNNVYTSEFTVPPVVLMNRHFECYCYLDDGGRIQKKTLKVHISKGIVKRTPGCDFNDEYRESTAITTFNNMNRKIAKACDSYPRGGDTITLLCPVNYTVQPDGCFNQVYVKKEDIQNDKNKLEERFNISRKWEQDKYKVVSIETLFGKKLDSVGDEITRFAKIPVTNDEISFTCTCKANDGSDTLMMNVYINESYDKFVQSSHDKSDQSNQGNPVQSNQGNPVHSNQGNPVQSNQGNPIQSNYNKYIESNKRFVYPNDGRVEYTRHKFSSTSTVSRTEERSGASSSFFAYFVLCALSLLFLG
ncbi:6-cysteine protein [Plasmodium knowlesi strain H]|uniref:6-cysteine protein n=3 Tax=Plasmodium knowlesi TaxID=5850 RepID=A0A5K1UBX7_PLAKH|nr:6-cysteine protein [Plasmodium knowlesi strain H]OTN67047.1 6-cysteine protein [Plasmodium knowlesi]CAA9988760.1 6-cysteine protein [Plasmodium knowlesi strain H]SBO21709.1 6-cysteine protein [Plasmodium knowlesi strain H]SBO22093.1 6-cysteine protein [Plasmodium knowlesi strain H]VVS78234.1 6-cysteine protein [Plasmodium knowlesi strain H]|eukprot:XP_002259736.1 s48/45-like protein [Plasmodium knowlesi strain H]